MYEISGLAKIGTIIVNDDQSHCLSFMHSNKLLHLNFETLFFYWQISPRTFVI